MQYTYLKNKFKFKLTLKYVIIIKLFIIIIIIMYTVNMQVTLPVYLNSTRAELLFTLDFKAEDMSSSGDHHYYERGVALLASTL